MNSVPARLLAILAASLALTACVAPTRIESTTAGGIDIAPEKLFVFSHIGREFGDGFYEPFLNRFSARLTVCGVRSAITTVGDLDLDNGVHTGKMKAFDPDYTMVIRRTGGTRMDFGRVIHAVYDVQLAQAQAPAFKAVWRANVNFFRGGTAIPIANRGEALANDVVDKMIADGVLKNCPVPSK